VADSPSTLCTAAQLTSGAFADLFRDYSTQGLNDLLIESTRYCEGLAGRRFAPFTTTETHRAEGVDPDEYTDAANLPLDLQGTLGRSYAYAIGASTLVRHMNLNEYAVRYPEMWTYSNTTITVYRSYGGNQTIAPAQIIAGPDPDSGHVFFQLGQFIPIGSQFNVAYSGGYTVSTPADLVRAGKLMTAWMAVRELNPEASEHDPDQLHTDAAMILENYERA
jgi:hypothetical protein